jgi:hypothetical protein
MLASLFGIAIALFVTFSIRGGVILRVGGAFLIIASGAVLLFEHKTGEGIVGAVLGLLLWLLGQWAYVVAYGEYRSAIGEYFVRGMRLPQLEAARKLRALQHQLSRGVQVARTKRPSLSPKYDDAPPDAQAIREGVEQAGDAAADILRPRLEATLEEAYGPDWLTALNKHRTKSRGFAVPDLADPRVVLHTLAFNPAFRAEHTHQAARQLLDLQNAAHHRRSLPEYELTRAWDLARALGAPRRTAPAERLTRRT